MYVTQNEPSDELTIYGLVDAAQYSPSTLSETTWTGGSDGTAAGGNNLQGSLRNDPMGRSWDLPNSLTTGALGSMTFAAGVDTGMKQITITDLAAFRSLVANDTNGEITLMIRGNRNTKVNQIASVFNSGGHPVPTLSATGDAPELLTAPAAPGDLLATPGDASISLSWVDHSDNESGFILQRSTTPGSGFDTVATTGANLTSYTDTGLDAGTAYYYQVIATNSGGDSGPSAEAGATTWTKSEAWRDQYFGVIENSGDAADDFDFDGDGIENLLERAFGTSPVAGNDSSVMPTGGPTDFDGTEHMSLTYRRLRGGSGSTGINYTVNGLTYTVEYNTDLTDPWNSGSVEPVGDPVDNGDGTESVTVRLTTPIGTEPRGFVRLKVTSSS